ELRRHIADRRLHHLDPAQWNARVIALKEGGHDLALQEPVQTLRLSYVIHVLPVEGRARWDRPAQLRPVGLVPPAVEDAHVERAVGARLHATGAARLEESARIVEPHVGAVHEVPSEGYVVVLEEYDAWFLARQADDPGDDLLARLVGGV